MRLETESGPQDLRVDYLAIAGWTGRDKAQVDHHIAELQAIGVRAPSRTPLFYRISSTLLTTETQISVLGDSTSGEAEAVIIRQDDRLWLGLGSDHTDRELEKTSVAASEQACAKPLAAQVWDYHSVASHIETANRGRRTNRDSLSVFFPSPICCKARTCPGMGRCSAARCRLSQGSGVRPGSACP